MAKPQVFFVGAQRFGNYFRARVRLGDGSHRFSRERFPSKGAALNYGTRWVRLFRQWGTVSS